MTTQRKLTAKGHLDARVTFYLKAYRGRVWITSYDCPSVCEAILEITEADALVELINQTAREAHGHRTTHHELRQCRADDEPYGLGVRVV
ncbi:MAG: hypothetical protein LC808_19700, partial [Actinobacteria bacterium]|nr:hypothetical protein [Actinomycetota bacterium]